MGLSCLIQARQLSQPDTFVAPSWAAPITKESLAPYRLPNMDLPHENYWYLELGGDRDSINDTEMLRKELLEEAMGLWNYIKNDPENVEKNRFWHLDWIGFLPGKRESRRYVGDYTINQNDVINQTAFDDIVAYGGWSMDTHHPSGMRTKEKPTIYHAAPSPYGIPYRCLYSVNVPNLMFAGRNISCTHMAFSSCRVMATCAIMGQAIGTAAALCLEKEISPRELSLIPEGIEELKQTLMKDDCYLPGQRRMLSSVMEGAEISGVNHSDLLINGIDRPIDDVDNGCYVNLGEPVTLNFPERRSVHQLRLVFDSNLDRVMPYDEERTLKRSSLCNRPLNCPDVKVPETLIREFRVDILDESGLWKTVCLEKESHQRLVYVPINTVTNAVRFIPLSTWGTDKCHLFALEAE